MAFLSRFNSSFASRVALIHALGTSVPASHHGCMTAVIKSCRDFHSRLRDYSHQAKFRDSRNNISCPPSSKVRGFPREKDLLLYNMLYKFKKSQFRKVNFRNFRGLRGPSKNQFEPVVTGYNRLWTSYLRNLRKKKCKKNLLVPTALLGCVTAVHKVPSVI